MSISHILPAHVYRFSRRLLFVCTLVFSASGFAERTPNFVDYSADVAVLLEEYHVRSDDRGSMLPSVLSYQGSSSAETLIDFDRGLITISAANSQQVKQAAVEILLTQIDPAIIDASTASDFGLINSKNQKPFFYEQIVDQDGLPIASVWRANRFVDYEAFSHIGRK